jgi:Macrocin-O-methyltransferase (TylF)
VAPPDARRSISRVCREQLTFLGERALLDLYRLAARLDRAEGVIVEAGCARGGSALVIAGAKSPERPFYVYDVFGLIPPPSDKDGEDVHKRYEVIARGEAGENYYGYEEDLDGQVRESFTRFGLPVEDNNVHLVKGFYEVTLNPSEPVALAHIDCDWYDSVTTCLSRIEPLLVPGGVMVVDDYHTWSGCKQAVDDYFADKQDEFTFRHGSRLHVERRPSAGA